MDEEMKEMMEALIEMTVEMMGNEKLIDAMATFTRSYYDKLQEKGFSKEEALQIVVAAAHEGLKLNLNK